MLVIRPEQMDVFRRAARASFEEEMVAHGRAFSPRLSGVIGDEQLRLAVRRTLDRADGYGFTNRGPIRLCVELMFLFGSGFDTDPQYPWAAEILQAPDDQMRRAEQLFDRTLDYQARVSGPGRANTYRALRELSAFAGQRVEWPSDGLPAALRREMARVFPAKAAYVGDAGLAALIAEGSAEARRYGLPAPAGDALLVVLMFAFGHGCTDDPLYPWIANTLRDERIVAPAARTDRLQRKALTWLDHVLASLGGGAPT